MTPILAEMERKVEYHFQRPQRCSHGEPFAPQIQLAQDTAVVATCQ
jgi:hypothetical protein